MKIKTCSSCHQPKPASEYGKNRQTPDGLMYYCRICASEKQRDFRVSNPESTKKSKQKYLTKVRARNDEQRSQTAE